MSTFFDFFDLPVLKYLTQFAGLSDAFDHLVYAVSEYDTFKGVLIFSALWFLWFYQNKIETAQDREDRRVKLLIVMFCTISSVIVARIMQKLLSIHLRPIHLDLGIHFPTVLDPTQINPWNSFPSDHAVYFCAFATGLWLINRRISLAVFAWTLIMVCMPRLYLGLHYPSDIIGGILFGVLWTLVLERVALLQVYAKRLLAWSKTHQGTFYWLAFLLTINAAHLFDDIREMAKGLVSFMK